MTSSKTEQVAGRAAVSVIVPSYNCGRFIAEALDSILGQTLQVEQIVVVDDGSKDDTEKVVARYTDPRVQYIKQNNAGVASARNTGLNACRGEFVTFLDADDRWRPTFVEKMVRLLSEDLTVACVFSNFVRFQHATGEILKDQFQYYPELRQPVFYADAPHAHGRIPKELAFSVLVACGEIPAYTQVMMFRRSLIENTRFEQSLVLGEDTNFALKSFLQGGVVFTDEVLCEVRRHDTNATRDFGEMKVHKLNGLKALSPHVTREIDVVAYRDRLIKAHIDAALYQTKLGRVKAGLRTYRDTFRVPGSFMRKIKGSVRMAMVLPLGLTK